MHQNIGDARPQGRVIAAHHVKQAFKLVTEVQSLVPLVVSIFVHVEEVETRIAILLSQKLQICARLIIKLFKWISRRTHAKKCDTERVDVHRNAFVRYVE